MEIKLFGTKSLDDQRAPATPPANPPPVASYPYSMPAAVQVTLSETVQKLLALQNHSSASLLDCINQEIAALKETKPKLEIEMYILTEQGGNMHRLQAANSATASSLTELNQLAEQRDNFLGQLGLPSGCKGVLEVARSMPELAQAWAQREEIAKDVLALSHRVIALLQDKFPVQGDPLPPRADGRPAGS